VNRSRLDRCGAKNTTSSSWRPRILKVTSHKNWAKGPLPGCVASFVLPVRQVFAFIISGEDKRAHICMHVFLIMRVQRGSELNKSIPGGPLWVRIFCHRRTSSMGIKSKLFTLLSR
jgi:hypothetical protein